MKGLFRTGGRVLFSLLIVIASAWAFGALWFDCPIAAATHAVAFAYLGTVLVLALLSITWCRWWRSAVLVAAVLSALVALWWSFLEPSNHRDWQTDVSREPWAEVNGDLVTLHNVRNFDYRADDTAGEKNPRWETRWDRWLMVA